jgi:hypothetical protein
MICSASPLKQHSVDRHVAPFGHIILIPSCLECVRSCVLAARSGQTKDYNICICCFSAKHAALMRKSKKWLDRNQNNVSGWSNISTRGLLFTRGENANHYATIAVYRTLELGWKAEYGDSIGFTSIFLEQPFINQCFNNAALMRKSKKWLDRNQNNVSGWSNISTRGLLFQWASTIKTNSACWSSTKWTSSIVTYFCHNTAYKILVWR